MKRNSILSLVLCIILTSCITPQVVYAQSDIPLTSANSCHYYDPAQTGQGIDLRVFDATETAPARVFGTLYVGAIPAYFRYAPSWFSVQGSFADGDGDSQTFPVYQVEGVVLGEANPLGHVEAGHVRLTATSDTTIAAELRLDLQSGFSPPEAPIDVVFAFRCLVR